MFPFPNRVSISLIDLTASLMISVRKHGARSTTRVPWTRVDSDSRLILHHVTISVLLRRECGSAILWVCATYVHVESMLESKKFL